jgi:DNA-directed RNA polymerase specialized sigma24 family protein
MGNDMTSVALQDAQQPDVELMPSLRKFARSLSCYAEARSVQPTPVPTPMQVRAEVEALPEDQRVAVMLVCVSGLTYQEAATVLGIPVGTLMSRLCRGRLELARRCKAVGSGGAGYSG